MVAAVVTFVPPVKEVELAYLIVLVQLGFPTARRPLMNMAVENGCIMAFVAITSAELRMKASRLRKIVLEQRVNRGRGHSPNNVRRYTK